MTTIEMFSIKVMVKYDYMNVYDDGFRWVGRLKLK